jgi:GTPase SAR1 family protein
MKYHSTQYDAGCSFDLTSPSHTCSPLQFIFKIVLLGDSGVGKSNLVFRFTKNEFNKDSKSTIGEEFATKTVQIEDNKLVKAQICGHGWTGTLSQYRVVVLPWCRGRCWCTTLRIRNSFNHVPMWLKEVEENAEKDCLIMLVGKQSRSQRPTHCLCTGRAIICEKEWL